MLLDTNAFIWFVRGEKRLAASLRDAIADRHIPIAVSMVAVWEITIKHRKGRLPMPAPFAVAPEETFASWCARATIDILPIAAAHISLAMRLDFPHDEPFDRLIAATAIAERRELVTGDTRFRHCAGLRVILV